jgi:hypothetical protein
MSVLFDNFIVYQQPELNQKYENKDLYRSLFPYRISVYYKSVLSVGDSGCHRKGSYNSSASAYLIGNYG